MLVTVRVLWLEWPIKIRNLLTYPNAGYLGKLRRSGNTLLA